MLRFFGGGDGDGGDEQVDVAWVAEQVGMPDVVVKVEQTTMTQGMSGARMIGVNCMDADDRVVLTCVVKRSPGGDIALQAGLVREVKFYNDQAMMKDTGVRLPRVYYAAADAGTGAKVMMMEDLSHGVQAGYFFDPAQPNTVNSQDDVTAKVAASGGVTSLRVARAAFVSAASMHRRYWCDDGLRTRAYLRGAQWTEESWGGGQGSAVAMMNTDKVRQWLADDRWSVLRALLEASCARSTWPEYVRATATRPFTLVHGDFHPANMMVLPLAPPPSSSLSSSSSAEHKGDDDDDDSDVRRLCLLDWEMVGVGSGPQELGQFLISHATTDFRRKHERALVELYHQTLTQQQQQQQQQDGERVVAVSFDDVWDEYVHGGFCKFLWFMPLLINWGSGDYSMPTYFANKLTEFAADHHITVDNVQMLRFF